MKIQKSLHRGIIGKDNTAHQLLHHEMDTPKSVIVKMKNGQRIRVPKYADTVVGKDVKYSPATNCDGMFMPYKYQFNNNCYNYAVNIATNSYAQPGRYSGIVGEYEANINPLVVEYNAQQDGLIKVEGIMSSYDLNNYTPSRGQEKGHFVGLMVAEGSDYHWCRCNIPYSSDKNTKYDSWSQKDGNDFVTNFDFAGNLIENPAEANWIAPSLDYKGKITYIVYTFHCFMYVANNSVNII